MRSQIPASALAPLLATLVAALTLGCQSTASVSPAPGAPVDTAADVPEAFSLAGEPLYRPDLPAETRADFEAKLADARALHETNPTDPDALVWLGRRTAYLGRYREAAEIFSRGIAEHPEDARFLRHRGHRFLTLRRPELAEADLARAAGLVRGTPDQVEPDGLPNPQGIPTSTLQSNIHYHLGLARYLQGDFQGALAAYRDCMAVSTNPDMEIATAYWLYRTLRRLGDDAEAARLLDGVEPDLELLENHAYHRLLLLEKGVLPESEVLPTGSDGDGVDLGTLGYGVARWHLENGREREGRALLQRVIEESSWAAFGHLAAEADLVR